MIGDFENKGRQWRKRGTQVRINDHDSPAPSVPHAYRYGIYDVGTDRDTGAFAGESLRGWW
ncbi:MAG: hypothetical protein EXS30_03135 [Pedosphaera sp.]|nr:hypothetical protein [Pedosphaera sp.]